MSFYSEIILRDPRHASLEIVRDVTLLEPGTRAAVAALVAEAAANAHRLVVLETYRSQARQGRLFLEGATQLRHVGCHGYGVAADIGVESATGAIDWKADYGLLGELAEKHGLIWGGDWGTPKCPHSFRDYDHVQRVPVFRQPALFAGEWYPPEDYDPYVDMRAQTGSAHR